MVQKCPMCHSRVAGDAKLCEKCGFNLTGKEEKKEEQKKVQEEQPKVHHKEHHKKHEVKHIEGHVSERYQFEPKKSLFPSKMLVIGIIAAIGIVGAATAILFAANIGLIHVAAIDKYLADSETKSTGTTPPAPVENNTSNDTIEPEINDTPVIPVIPEDPPEKKIADYLAENKLDAFPELDKRIIEVQFVGNKSILRFRVSTTNPAQESLYLLGVQLLVFPDISIANSTGYNADGKIISDPDTRKQETRKIYWRKYSTKTDWFPNLELEPECKVDADCEDKNACTIDQCLSTGFCSNARRVSEECPGIV